MMAQVKDWVETYGGMVTTELNAQRCYAVQQMKHACNAHLEQTKGAKLPTVEEIQAVVDRTSDDHDVRFPLEGFFDRSEKLSRIDATFYIFL